MGDEFKSSPTKLINPTGERRRSEGCREKLMLKKILVLKSEKFSEIATDLPKTIEGGKL